MEKKSNSIRFRLTPELESAIKQGAIDRNMTISEYCRLCLMAHHNLDGSDDLPTITKIVGEIDVLFKYVNYHHPILKQYKEVIPIFQKMINDLEVRFKVQEEINEELSDRISSIRYFLDNQQND